MAASTAQQHAMLRAAIVGDVAGLRSILDDVNTAVVQAFGQNGAVQCARLLIHAGANIETPFHSGATPLMIAAGKGHETIVEMLLCARASVATVASDGGTALALAKPRARHGERFERIVEMLEDEIAGGVHPRLRVGDLTTLIGLQSRPELNRAPARVVSEYDEARGRYGVQALLISELLGVPELGGAMGGGECLRVRPVNLLERGQALPPPPPEAGRSLPLAGGELVKVMVDNRPRVFAALLATRPELASQPATFVQGDQASTASLMQCALSLSAPTGAPTLVRAILSHAPEAVEAPIRMSGGCDFTPLCIACHTGRADLVSALLASGARVDSSTPTCQTPLLAAISQKCLGCVRLLLSHGADVELADQEGYRPLLAAAEWGVPRALALLLEHKACPTSENRAVGPGYCALIAAVNNCGSGGQSRAAEYGECVRLLLAAKANPSAAVWTPTEEHGFERGRTYTPLEVLDFRIRNDRSAAVERFYEMRALMCAPQDGG